jgi:hypothetical protein
VEASSVKLPVAMEGEPTTHTVPTHTTAESTTAESATHPLRAHTATVRAHTTTVSATTVSATTVSATTVTATTVTAATVTAATMSATTTGRCNSWGKGNRNSDCGGDGNGHEGLSKHRSRLRRADPSDGDLRGTERLITPA